MDNSIIPELESVFPVEYFHRILPQYAALKWFCDKVCNLHTYICYMMNILNIIYMYYVCMHMDACLYKCISIHTYMYILYIYM